MATHYHMLYGQVKHRQLDVSHKMLSLWHETSLRHPPRCVPRSRILVKPTGELENTLQDLLAFVQSYMGSFLGNFFEGE